MCNKYFYKVSVIILLVTNVPLLCRISNKVISREDAMSLFDKAKRAVNRAVDSAVTKSVTGAVENAVGDFFTSVGVNPKQIFCQNCGKQLNSGTRFCTSCGAKIEQQPQNTAQQAEPSYAPPCACGSMPEYFTKILSEDFSDYTVQRFASAASIGIAANIPSKPYDFALVKNGAVAGVIMLTEHNRDRNSAFLNAKNAALSAGVPFINFYTHMANERGYVVSRIRAMAR